MIRPGWKLSALLILWCGALVLKAQPLNPPLSPKAFLPGMVSLPQTDELSISFSSDSKEMIFTRRGVGVYHSRRTGSDDWSPPKQLEFPGTLTEIQYPMYTPDGMHLSFVDGNSKAYGFGDIYIAKRTAGGFGTPKKIPQPANSQKREGGHSFTLDNTLYFTSGRIDSIDCGCSDVYKTKWVEGKYTTPQLINELNTIYDEEFVFISPDEAYAIVQSWRIGVPGKHNLYISYRLDEHTWTPLTSLGESINTDQIESSPFVLADRSALFFRRGWKDNGKDADIYWVDAKSIFKPYQQRLLQPVRVKSDVTFELQVSKELFGDYDGEVVGVDIVDLQPGFEWNKQQGKVTGRLKEGTSTIKVIGKDTNQNRGVAKIQIVVE